MRVKRVRTSVNTARVLLSIGLVDLDATIIRIEALFHIVITSSVTKDHLLLEEGILTVLVNYAWCYLLARIDLRDALSTLSYLVMLLVDELMLVLDQDIFKKVRIVEVYQVISINTLVNITIGPELLLLVRGFAISGFQLGDLS